MHIDVLDFAPAAARPTTLFGRVRQAVAHRIAEHREYTRIHNELLKLDRREMEELGIGPADFDSIARGTYSR
ncbi:MULTISPECIES: hypothetical protein [Inquilinus]|jgi:uncharacterized protein YjiS (DUF1127 family)|uniref:Uncharacterized protein YjiS (DUF1127 family) n=1 Tax=Inquilinus ginsengisoli TaxID=363840 RepID=A0ABU1JSD5_9PROT|nr:hypothetical protein [Inquilinus ginsengisoli]MDR6291535.1 uncharacterized protein YjiS (DUF1127 family) [Inquilinus ginsengisoli]